MVARLQEGNNVEFRCVHTLPDPSPMYKWSRVDGKPLPVGRSLIKGRLGESVYITRVKPADSGLYVCRVLTDFGEFSSTSRLVVGKRNFLIGCDYLSLFTIHNFDTQRFIKIPLFASAGDC